MSQVRKFDKGGETAAPTKQESSTAKTYKLIINGKEINLDQDGLAEFRKAGSGGGGMMGNVYADIADALESGHTVKYNSDSNTISGVDFKRVDPKAIFKANENQVWDRRAQRRANRYARNNNLTHQFNSALASIGNINFEKRKEESSDSDSSSSLTSLYSTDPRRFDYNKGEDGTLTWSNGPQNAGNLTALNNFIDMLGMSEEDAKKKYSWTGYDDQIRDLRSWYTGNQNYDWEGLRSRIRGNQLTEDDWDVLRYMGFGESQSNSDFDPSTVNIPRSYEGSGLNDDWLTRNNYYARKGSDGNTYLYRLGTDENGKPKYLIDTSAKIYLPNMGILGDNSQWNGGAIINGRFYTENEIWDPNSIAGQSFAELTRAWNSGSGATSWQNAKNTGWQFAGSNADNYMFSTYDRNTGTNPLWDQYFNQYKDDDNIWYVRNLANNFSGIPKGMEIISYIDQNNRARAGYENPYFAVYNPNDRKFRRFENEEALSSYLQGLNIQKQSSLYSGDANFDIYDFLFDKNKNKYSYVSPINTFTGTGSSQQSTELYKGPDGNYYYLLDNSNPDDLQFIRIDDQNVINQILNGQTISNENLPSWAKRRLLERGKRKYMKQGGKINFDKISYLQKHQYGGIFSNPYTGSTNKKERNKDAKITIGDSHQAFGGGKHGVRTNADKLANWATGFDTAAVGTSFVPVYGNIVGAVSGLTGSALRFASDIKKDGFQGKDLWKFLGNIGLDALTLIPGLGSAAAGVKAAKGASKVAKVASTIAKGAGKVSKWGDTTKIGKAVTYGLPALGVLQGTGAAIQAATDGQPLTTDQLQTIAGGLMGGVILGNKAGKFVNNKALKSVQKELGLNKLKSYEYKTKDKTISLTKDEIAAFANKKVSEVNEYLYNKIKNAGIELEKPDFETATLWKDFGITGKVSKKGIKGWWGNKLKITPEKSKSIENSILQNEDLAKRLSSPKSWTERRAQKAYSEQILQNPELATFVRKVTGVKVRPQGQWTFGGWGTRWINRNKPTTSQSSVTVNTPTVTTQNNQPKIAGLLPAWKGNNIPEVNILPSSNSPITTPSSPLIQIPQFASSYQNAQGQLLLPRGDGRFFKKTQRVWNGGPAHEIVSRQPAKYSATPKKSRFRNIGLEQAHKQRVLQEAGRQQVPAIRGLQEDIAKVRTSKDFKNLLVKINNRDSYKEIIKNNPEIKDQLRQMFVHLDPVRLGNWMTKYNLRFKKGGKIVKAQPGTKMPFGTFVQDNSLDDPNLYDYSKSGIQFNGSNIDWTKTYGQGKFMDLRNYYLNNWDNEAFKPIKDAYMSQLSTGNNNVDLTNFTKDDFSRLTQDQRLGYAHNLWTDQLRKHLYDTGDIFKIFGINNNKDTFVPYLNSDGTPMTMQQTYDYLIGRGVPEEQVKEYVSRNAGKFANSYNTTELEAATVTASSKPQIIPSNPDESQVARGQEVGSRVGRTKSGRGFNWNPDDLIGLANLGYSVHKNNQMYGVIKDSIRDAGKGLMKEMPTEIYDRYQDHITPIYQEAANQKRQWIPISTDPIVNYSIRQANEDAAQALLTEGRLKASEQYTDYLDKDLAARRTYADQRRQIADANRATLANIIMQLGQNDAARRLANNRSVQNYIMEFRNKLAQDRQKKKQFQLQDAQVQAQNAYNAKYNELGNRWLQEFNALSDTEKKAHGTWEGYWMDKNINDYNNAIEQATIASRNIIQDFYPTQLDYFRYKPSKLVSPSSTTKTVYYGKKGGKTPTYLKRHTGQKPDEAIWIQRNKDTAKALEKLHDAVIKLFMKALS